MISPLRATAIIGVGTLATMATSVVVAKALAILVGPDGVGRLGLLQSVLGLTAIVAGLGVNVAIVRELASALAASEGDRAAALRRAGLIIAVAAGVVGGLALMVFREPLAASALGSSDRAFDLVLLALALPLQLVAGVEFATLNGYHRIRSHTVALVLASVAGGSITVGLVAAMGQDGIAASILVSALAAAAVAIASRRRALGSEAPTVPAAIGLAIRRVLRFGTPYTASQLVGTGAHLLLPILILSSVGTTGVGHYRAAAAIGVAYLAILLNAMERDYLPRVAAAPPEEIGVLIERRTRILVALAVPVILTVLAIAPIAVTLLYSEEFLPAVDVLQWQLVGDLLKLPAWALSFVLLARASFARFLALEAIGGVTLAAATMWLSPLIGLAGVGIAFVLTYAIYYIAAWLLVRPVFPVVPGRVQLAVVGTTLACVSILAVLPDATITRGAVFGAGAVAAAAVAWPFLWRHHRSGQLL